MAANQQKIGVDRKRTLPSSADLTVPPNKKIPKPTAKEQLKLQREKELLYQRSALESRTPFCLQPRIQYPNMPVVRPTTAAAAAPKPYSTSLGSPAFYPYLPTPSTPGSTTTSGTAKPYSVSDIMSTVSTEKGAASPKPPLSTIPASPYSSFGPPSVGRPPSVVSNAFSPWSPFHGNLISGLPTPPSNESMLNRIESTDDQQNDSTAPKTDKQKLQYPPTINRTAVPGSPFVYMYNSPPMVLVRSPCGPTSVQSVPSVSSSSGCSTMSEGSDRRITQPPAIHRIAPTEYHVGVKVPNPPSTDDSCGSDGLATPTPDSDDDDDEVDVERVEPCNTDTTMTAPMSCVPTPASVSVCSPLSVQSLVGTGGNNRFKSTQHQTNQTQLQHPKEQQYYTPLHYTHQRQIDNHHLMSPMSSRDSSPEPELDNSDNISPSSSTNKMSMPSTPVTGDDVFSLVPGRLSLLSATQKYKITVDEVRRRLSSPECLNASVLGGILRRAKSKNGGHHLRQNLEEKGLSLPPGRRKQTDITLFTSLVEGEALHLANDHRRICQNFFPHHELAQIIGQQHANSPQNQERQRMVEGARVLLSEFQAMVDAVGRPSNLSPNDPSNPYPGLTNFNLISHGFGNPSISTAVSVIQNYLLELSKIYDNSSTVERPSFDANNSNNGMAAVLPAKHPVVMGNSSSNSSGGNHGNHLHGYTQLPMNLLKQEPKEM